MKRLTIVMLVLAGVGLLAPVIKPIHSSVSLNQIKTTAKANNPVVAKADRAWFVEMVTVANK